MNIRLAREQQRAALTLLRELMSAEEKEVLEQVEEHLGSIGLTLPEVQILISHAPAIFGTKTKQDAARWQNKGTHFQVSRLTASRPRTHSLTRQVNLKPSIYSHKNTKS